MSSLERTAAEKPPALAKYRWQRHAQNPVLPPIAGSAIESRRCMNPCAVRTGGELRLYYGGGADDGKHRICLATAKPETPHQFERRGVVLDIGAAGAFDEKWCVLPLVHRFGGVWHLYYTGQDTTSNGLQSFRGIGLATSRDGLSFTRHSESPVITGDQIDEFKNNRGVAGGGTILEDMRPDGSTRYRMYYTLAVGTKHPDPRIDQEKLCAVCHSSDGIRWDDHRIILRRRDNVPTEDYAVAAPFVWRDGSAYRMLYSAIGSRWGFYSLCEAVSADGYTWHRGDGDNVSLAPVAGSAWESQMVEYASVLQEDGGLRLYYCGNNYGGTGIGMATCALRD